MESNLRLDKTKMENMHAFQGVQQRHSKCAIEQLKVSNKDGYLFFLF